MTVLGVELRPDYHVVHLAWHAAAAHLAAMLMMVVLVPGDCSAAMWVLPTLFRILRDFIYLRKSSKPLARSCTDW